MTKCVEVNNERYKSKLINDVIPAIKQKWPAATISSPICIQQNNDNPHRVNDDPDLLEACSSDGFDMKIINQPPNRPEANILDLFFFASTQSLRDRTRARTIDQLIDEVNLAWERAESAKLSKVWASLQACMEQILLCGGENTYKPPHRSKDGDIRAKFKFQHVSRSPTRRGPREIRHYPREMGEGRLRRNRAAAYSRVLRIRLLLRIP